MEHPASALLSTYSLRVHRIEWEADDIVSVELRSMDGGPLAPFTAGAHIELRLPNELSRSYSLAGDQADCGRYIIGVGLNRDSRGGSRYIHTQLRVGQTIPVSAPRNNFELVEEAEHSVFIAGGIGITPIFSMMQRLAALGRSFELHYAVMTRKRAAFLDKLRRLGGEVTLHCDDEHGGRQLDITTLIRSRVVNSHLYCCGPASMLEVFEAATSDLDPNLVHLEYFAPRLTPAATSSSFKVVLARSQRELAVPADKSILDVLLEAGIDVANSCRDGVCATCEVRVLEGEPDHRDYVMSKVEQEKNASMMVCVSRSSSERLVLDL